MINVTPGEADVRGVLPAPVVGGLVTSKEDLGVRPLDKGAFAGWCAVRSVCAAAHSGRPRAS